MSKDAPVFIQEIIKTSSDMWQKGWAEANGGNISLRLRPEKTGDLSAFGLIDMADKAALACSDSASPSGAFALKSLADGRRTLVGAIMGLATSAPVCLCLP